MAAPTFDAAVPSNSFLFDIYNDGQQPAHNAPPALALPGGPCNYTDQTLPRCGCRRFWSKQAVLGRGGAGGVFGDPALAHTCMCSHHACFHEDVQPGLAGTPVPPTPLPLPSPVVSLVGQENEKPRSNREPLSPVQDLTSFQVPSNMGGGASLDLTLFNFESSLANQQLDAVHHPPGNEDVVAPGEETPLPDTLSWGAYTRGQGTPGDLLPPIPSQCLLSQGPPSTASSTSQTKYLRPFAGKGLQTLSSGTVKHSSDLVIFRSAEDSGDDEGPSIHDSKAKGVETPRASSFREQNTSLTLSHPNNQETIQDLSNTVQSHEERLDKLENASFSVVGHDDCLDKHDHTDLRVTELESRVEQVESLLNNDNSSVGSVRRLRGGDVADDATASVASMSTNATARISGHSSELYSQVQALQAQVNQLQAASLPTYNSPWELEVVFLPFPLKGVWRVAREFPSQRQSGTTGNNADEWTQMPNTLSRSTPNPLSPRLGEWVGNAPTSDWLLPRAFMNGRTIDQRLRSRGLIKTVLIRGADARTIQLAINNAFGDILRVCSNMAVDSTQYEADPRLAAYLGLRQAWVPLRKIHKDPRLRFLAPAEMATPTLWNFSFLSTSVVMKATGVHRLYVTQPEAYLQDQAPGQYALATGWSWQKLRQLNRFYFDSQDTNLGDMTTADMEECWARNDTLDSTPPPNPAALSLRQQKMSRRPSSSPTQSFYTVSTTGGRSERTASPSLSRERKGSRPPHVRTVSLPPNQPIIPSPNQSRRRVASLNQTTDRRPSPRSSLRVSVSRSSPAVTHVSISKRRQSTHSPSMLPRHTPRWSRATSRSPSQGPLGPVGVAPSHDERRTTPGFGYATPYSNAPQEFNHRAGSRGPIPAGTWNDDDMNMDDDDDADDDYDDRGSLTDMSDGEGPASGGRENGRLTSGGGGRHRRSGQGLRDMRGDDDFDLYEDLDERDESGNEDEETDWSGQGHGHGQGQAHRGVDAEMRPEDIPWQGIESPMMSDGENMDPESSQDFSILEDGDGRDGDGDVQIPDHFGGGDGEGNGDGEDTRSEASSVPSEYPSTHPQWHIAGEQGMGMGMEGVSALGLAHGQQMQMQMVQSASQIQLQLGSSFQIHEDSSQLSQSQGSGASTVEEHVGVWRG